MTTFLSKKNNALSKVATVGGIDNSTNPVTFAVTTGEGAKFPSSNFSISIDNEILLCTSRTGDNLTCTRAQESTSIAAHSQNADVENRITAAALVEHETAITTLETSRDGWTPAGEAWSYASATTITVPSGAASRYQKGDKIKLTQTTVKYFYVVGVADTVLTITGGTDYTLANAAITENYYSHQSSPIGFPQLFSYTVAITYAGGSNPPTTASAIGKFQIVGNVVHFFIVYTVTNYTGDNHTYLILTLPLNYVNANAASGVQTLNSGNPVGAGGYSENNNKITYYLGGAITANGWLYSTGSFMI